MPQKKAGFATHRVLYIGVARRINSLGVLETMADVMLVRGIPEDFRCDNGDDWQVIPELAREF